MAEDGFEMDVQRLFAEAPAMADADAFVAGVAVRTARRRRMARALHAAAYSIGGLIAVLELSQPSLWQGLADWLNRAGAPLLDARLWTTPNPMFCAAVLGALVLGAYLSRLLRES
ncbi:MAG: hypothetical protein JWO33_1317 [Caulobacteraceae bacterium]|nr:hypothetical protein [Caulobacteraceae bacterium]